MANETENQIVVYQPDGVMRIEVRFDGETVWLPQSQIAELFSCSLENVRLHLKNIYASGELEKTATSKESLEVRKEGLRNVTRKFFYYNLDAIISIGYRVNSIVGVRFRQWATQVIKERMFAGAMQAAQFAAIDRRLLSHEKDIAELKDKVDFFVQTREPPLQGVFYEGQLWDACSLLILSFGSPAAFALSIAVLKRKLPAGSAPPIFAATIISLENFWNVTPLAASTAAFLCLIVDHLECPDIYISFHIFFFYITIKLWKIK